MSKFRSTKFRQPKGSDVQRLVFKKGDTICNLCEQKHNLTYDHIPPQCCGNDKLTIARRIYADDPRLGPEGGRGSTTCLSRRGSDAQAAAERYEPHPLVPNTKKCDAASA